MIEIAGKKLVSLDDEIRVNGKRIAEVWVNNKKVYPEGIRVRNAFIKVTIYWNNANDEDLHCEESNGEHIYYGHTISSVTKGYLNHDIVNPIGMAEEHIIWENGSTLVPGNYQFYVYTFSYRNGTSGFYGTVQIDNREISFSYDASTRPAQYTYICDILVDSKGYCTFIKPDSYEHHVVFNGSFRRIQNQEEL